MGLPAERWLSGRRQRFAKPSYWATGTGGSNPPLSAIIFVKHRDTHPGALVFVYKMLVFNDLNVCLF